MHLYNILSEAVALFYLNKNYEVDEKWNCCTRSSEKIDDKENMIVKVAATLQNFGFSHPL
jgi:hypothetical protein